MGGRAAETTLTPGLHREEIRARAGYRTIAGVDEAGRGAWAGPLIAAAVILPCPIATDAALTLARLDGVRDSKLLGAERRELLLAAITATALGIGIGRVDVPELDAIGVGEANRLAWRRAVAALPHRPDFLLLDAFHFPDDDQPQEAIVRGDRECLSIAAASIVAKVTRDRLLAELGGQYPGYGFERHKGYGTAAHQAALRHRGPCPEHRRSFTPIRALLTTAGTVDAGA